MAVKSQQQHEVSLALVYDQQTKKFYLLNVLNLVNHTNINVGSYLEE